jgi:23S rRNA (guanine745-N1)-methyltransferase
VARRGYVALLAGGRAPPGDPAAMVAAREAFLAAGHFAPLADAVAAAVREAAPQNACLIADLGCGTGYLLRRVLRELPDCGAIGLDASPYALSRASRASGRIVAVRSDLWRELPIRDNAVGVAVSAFAPRNAGEVARIIGPGGALVLVAPTAAHLAQLRSRVPLLNVDSAKDERVRETIGTHLRAAGSVRTEFEMKLRPGDVEALVMMGPSAHHVRAESLQARIARLPPRLDVTASVLIRTFRSH